MSSFDQFAATLLEESKRFLEKAIESSDLEATQAFTRSSVLLGMSSLEAYINGISEELLTNSNFNILEKSLLSEKQVLFNKGQFELTEKMKISRLTDRIEFLYRKYKGVDVQQSDQDWWSKLKVSIKLRNSLVHPKEAVEITIEKNSILLESIIDCLIALSQLIYDKPFPFKNLGLQSKLTF